MRGLCLQDEKLDRGNSCEQFSGGVELCFLVSAVIVTSSVLNVPSFLEMNDRLKMCEVVRRLL